LISKLKYSRSRMMDDGVDLQTEIFKIMDDGRWC